MNESTNSENNAVELEKPVHLEAQNMDEEVKFPPIPEPKDEDFDEDITEEERNFYKLKFKDISKVVHARLHCTACDRHLGCSAQNKSRTRSHPMLRTLMCQSCYTFYNSGEFEKGDDGSELYCRWCGQGGQVFCCSNCPHVFCAKCIKRNLGTPMIHAIEATDDWKCFKCNLKYLWDLRAVCWALFRYSDFRNRITEETKDPVLKAAYNKHCTIDNTECCRHKFRRREKNEDKKQKNKEETKKNDSTPVKMCIQVKKFASINAEDQSMKNDKKVAIKRPSSPINKNKALLIKNPMSLAPKVLTPIILPTAPKKIRMAPPILNPIRFNNDGKQTCNTYSRIRPVPITMPVMYNGYSGNQMYNNSLIADNINLSLDNLTQGLDMATVAGISNNIPDNDVVCTPDFPLQPLCEGPEDNNDDDVQCMGTVVNPKNPPPLVHRNINATADLSGDNIIQMTDNDVTVNAATGGLKFRVDPQTLSSNKMYRLPDGRIFAINANPDMPGGYSARIVAITDDNAKAPSVGTTFAAKLSSVVANTPSPPPLKVCRTPQNRSFINRNNNKAKRKNTPKNTKVVKSAETPTRAYDLKVPVEWYRYNLIDAVDALEYSLQRLNTLKQEASTMYLRTRSLNEMRLLHRRLDRLLRTSSCRFIEIRENISKEFKQYLSKKLASTTSDEDDDVEILQDDDDPIFIDENSVESNANGGQDVDLTILGSSDHNDSSEKSLDKSQGVETLDPIGDKEHNNTEENVTHNSSKVDIIQKIQNNEAIDLDPIVGNNQQGDNKATDVDSKDKETCESEQNTESTCTDKQVVDSANIELKDKEVCDNEPPKNSTVTTDLEHKEEIRETDVNGDKILIDAKHKKSVEDTIDEILKDDDGDSSNSAKKTDQEADDINLLYEDSDEELDNKKGSKSDSKVAKMETETVKDISG